MAPNSPGTNPQPFSTKTHSTFFKHSFIHFHNCKIWSGGLSERFPKLINYNHSKLEAGLIYVTRFYDQYFLFFHSTYHTLLAHFTSRLSKFLWREKSASNLIGIQLVVSLDHKILLIDTRLSFSPEKEASLVIIRWRKIKKVLRDRLR